MGEATQHRSLLAELRLRAVDDGGFEVDAVDSEPERDVVFGGELLAQAIAASTGQVGTGKPVKSVHAVFARPGRYSSPYRLQVEPIHDGRAFASNAVTIEQGGVPLSRMLLLHSADEPDLLRYTTLAMPDVMPPEECPVLGPPLVFPGFEWRIVNGVDPSAPGRGGQPPEIGVWLRYRGELPSDEPGFAQGALAWATDGYFIGASMLPDADIDDTQTHRDISTGVVSHTVNFHEPFDPADWLLLAHEVVWAGRGRIHGRAAVFDQGGRLIATFTQDAMVRRFHADRPRDERRVM